MRALVISMNQDRDDRRAWSGTVYQAIKGLERAGYEVDYLWALRDHHDTFFDKLLCTYWLRIPGKFGRTTRMDESFYTYKIFKDTLRNFDYSPYDIVFVPTHIAIVNALPRKISAKVVHLVDATVDSLFNYYSEFTNLIWHNYREAHILGKRAFRRSDLIIASSDWCRNNAINQYGIPAEKISVVEFGANIDAADIPQCQRTQPTGRPVNIYWSGVNWLRKGGDVAVDCCRELIAMGIDVRLNITGMRQLPDDVAKLPWLVNHGFLDKNNAEQYHRLIDVMAHQDIFLFPSRAECSSIALCEANAFGLPCFVYDTGGTANYVVNGENGYMLPLSADGKSFADAISTMLSSGEYNRLSEGALNRYRSHLNWQVWSARVNQAITKMLS